MDVRKYLNKKNRLNQKIKIMIFYAQCLVISFDVIRCDFSSGRIHFVYRLPASDVYRNKYLLPLHYKRDTVYQTVRNKHIHL